jgi:hypothetical protein
VQAVRDALGLDRAHLRLVLGRDAGDGVRADATRRRREPRPRPRPASIPLWAEETNRLTNELPSRGSRVLRHGGGRLAGVRGGAG